MTKDLTEKIQKSFVADLSPMIGLPSHNDLFVEFLRHTLKENPPLSGLRGEIKDLEVTCEKSRLRIQSYLRKSQPSVNTNLGRIDLRCFFLDFAIISDLFKALM